MKTNPFPARRTRFEISIFIIAGLALIGCIFLLRYVIYPQPVKNLRTAIQRSVDSIVTHYSLQKDSAEIVYSVEYNNKITEYLADSLGTFQARTMLLSNNFEEIVQKVVIKKKSSSMNIQFGSNSSATIEEGDIKGDTAAQKVRHHYSRRFWFNQKGEIIGAAWVINQLPDGIYFRTLDTAKYVNFCLARVPKLWSEKVKNGGYQPVVDKCTTEETNSYYVLSRHGTMEERLYLICEKLSAKTEIWTFRWRHRWYVPDTKKDDVLASALRVGKITFAVVLGALVLMFIIVFMFRLRNRAVSLTAALWVAIVSSAYQGTFIFDNTFSILELFIIILALLIFNGFFITGIPVAGLLSLSRETFAEKFYTLKKVFSAPLQSRYVGRSLLLGLSFGILWAFIELIIFAVGEKSGADRFFSGYFFDDNVYELRFKGENGFILLLGQLFFFPLYGFVQIISAPTLMYKALPERYRVGGTVVVSILFSTLFTTVLSNNIIFALIFGCIFGVFFSFMAIKTDILVLVIASMIETMIMATNLLLAHPWVFACVIMMIVVCVVVGVMAYKQAPELVNVEEYKPKFVLDKEESNRMMQELAAAKSVQQKLLPACLPAVESVEICATCIPAFEVGGDYYDFFQLDAQHLGVLIGDVSGKGISAAFYITLAKGVIVSQVRQHGSPAEILHRVNALLYEVMERGKFVSMIYGIYNTLTREFIFANAGHNPAVLRQANGDTRLINSRGMAIGLDRGERFSTAVVNARVQLEKDDIVILYTDGVTEAMNAATEEYGEQRMLQCLNQQFATADSLVSSLLLDLKGFVGKAPQHDDITIVALKSV